MVEETKDNPAKEVVVEKVAKKVAAKKPAAKKAAAKKPAAKKAAAKKPAAKKVAAKKPSAKKPVAKQEDKTTRRSSGKRPLRILRIRLRSFDHKQINMATENILRTVRQTGTGVRGPIPLPTSRERFDLLRSPHVDKDSREQLEICIHHRLMDIVDPSPKTTDALTKVALPEGVDANLKMI